MTRLLHTADWQIGRFFGQFEPDEAALLAEARFEAIERLAALAATQRVDMIVVAGDVFDSQGVADKTIHRVFGLLNGFTGPWALLPGNHDAALTESVWTRAQRLRAIPPNVHLCLAPEIALFEEQGIALLPAPLTQRHTYVDLTDWFATAQTPPDMLRLGLAHGCVQGILPQEIDSPNPVAADRAEQARLDYLALGDWHGTKQIGPRCWYSGTPEPDRFRANDAGHALLVELTADRTTTPTVQRLQTGRYRWQRETLDFRVASDLERALQRLAEFRADDILQLRFRGSLSLADHRRLQDSLSLTRGTVRALLADDAELLLTPDDADLNLLCADGYLADVIAELQTGQQRADAEIYREALALLTSFLAEKRRDAPAAGAEA